MSYWFFKLLKEQKITRRLDTIWSSLDEPAKHLLTNYATIFEETKYVPMVIYCSEVDAEVVERFKKMVRDLLCSWSETAPLLVWNVVRRNHLSHLNCKKPVVIF